MGAHLWVASKKCVAGRPIQNALVRRQKRLGLCPKMKNHPLGGWIFISFIVWLWNKSKKKWNKILTNWNNRSIIVEKEVQK